MSEVRKEIPILVLQEMLKDLNEAVSPGVTFTGDIADMTRQAGKIRMTLINKVADGIKFYLQ